MTRTIRGVVEGVTGVVVPTELAPGAGLAESRYEIGSVLGRGGFGITYQGFDHRLERSVALKELFPESARRGGSYVEVPSADQPAFEVARQRFMREARVLARFSHPGIVRIFEVFEDNGTAYLVMELLEGRTLVDVLRQHGRPLAEDDLVDLAARVAAALRPVHAAGVLHRDVNPSNVVLTHHGRVVVIDFGLAREYQPDHTVGMTRVVTPGYAPIEQYRGEGHFGPSTDVYGLAATLYRLATGKVPIGALERSGGTQLVSPFRLNPDLSKDFSDAVLDGLELEPSHRPQDLDSFLARLGVAQLPTGIRARLLDSVPVPVPVQTADSAPKPVGPAVNEPVSPSGATPLPSPGATVAWTPDQTEVVMPESDPTRGRVVEATRHHDPREVMPGQTRYGSPPPPAPQPLAPPPQTPHPQGALPLPAAPKTFRRGRRTLTFPLLVLAVSLGGAAPVFTVAVLVGLVLPLIATHGDSVAHRLRLQHGVADGWAERRVGPAALAPVRFVRNVFSSVLRASPLVGLGAVLMAGWYGLNGLDLDRSVLDLALRAIGVVVAGSIALMSRHGSRRFRTGLGLDDLADRLARTGGVSERVVVLWLVAGALAAGAWWLSPSPFPLSP